MVTELLPGDSRHGVNGYLNFKCRCDVCREANRQRSADQKVMRLEVGLPDGDARHGTLNGYSNWSCRCEPCKSAGAASNKAGRESRMQRGLADGDARHGTANGYNNWGCRCDKCQLRKRGPRVRWRTRVDGQSIDAGGRLEPFQGRTIRVTVEVIDNEDAAS